MTFVRSSHAALLLATAGLLTGSVGCSSDWDLLDPRSGGGSAQGGSGSGAGSATGGATGASGGNGGASSGGSATGGVGGNGAEGGMGGFGGFPPGTLNLAPSVADCVASVDPDPDACEVEEGPGNMAVDGLVELFGVPVHSFLRFDVDGTISGRTVTSVVLQLTVSDHVQGDGPQSGDVWEVETFNRQGLFNAVPAQIGAAALVTDVGPVVQGQLVEFALPLDSVAANAPTTLGLYIGINDGIRYWNLNGAVPPVLVIDYD